MRVRTFMPSEHPVRYLVGSDMYCTFIDLALLDWNLGQFYTDKRLTNHDDPSLPILEGMEALATRAGITLGEVDQEIQATNAVMGRAGAVTCLSTTKWAYRYGRLPERRAVRRVRPGYTVPPFPRAEKPQAGYSREDESQNIASSHQTARSWSRARST